MRIVACGIEGDDETVMLATTLLDHHAAPAAELAALYHERWEIETTCDEVKTHILGPGAALRSKTPNLVFQEIDGLMLAHHAMRRLIHEAAEKVGEDPTGCPSCTPCVSCVAGSSIPAPLPQRAGRRD